MKCTRVLTALVLVATFSAMSRPAALATSANDPLEWWRLTGHLVDDAGRRFDVAAAFFRFASAGGPGAALPADFAIVDEDARRTYTSVRVEREGLGLGHAEAGALDVAVGDWKLASRGTGWRRQRITLHIHAGTTTLDLSQQPVKPEVVFGRAGMLRTGSCRACLARDVAYTRLIASGTIVLGGVRHRLRGFSWLDHESAQSELGVEDAGWDRFEIQFDDGRELMLRVLRHADLTTSPFSSGALVARDGRVTYLPAGSFTVENPLATHWQSSRTGTRYPSLFELSVPQAQLDLAVVPTVQDQEISLAPDGPSYYEATVDVERAGSPGDHGHGYVELTGYARPLRF